ncbi:MAG: hypothetical protein COU30_05050 [Candidatus Magasanikbacteria bacterium CG10_big_fil_rev_8_21_14_0_10_38_6]|uniref:Uncharacterized protein n=1 Tax=Candidatus Magasanikbacteria bacterium CG10_big_fil_rev_8_21_14_0_10_38_6 TaxID=1974647 RepID=A0A2M6P073_9BACT|nr:MAG: hypothetical protein COU30_05050 [Candidatus Magasanikbacteria bacterium CG10_big_fil_rev_8_21_14_0_10_38_6]
MGVFPSAHQLGKTKSVYFGSHQTPTALPSSVAGKRSSPIDTNRLGLLIPTKAKKDKGARNRFITF